MSSHTGPQGTGSHQRLVSLAGRREEEPLCWESCPELWLPPPTQKAGEEIQLQAQIPLQFGLKSSKTNSGLQAALTRNF